MTTAGRYGRDRLLTLGEYWNIHKLTIANRRGWECKGECGEKPFCLKKCEKLKHRLTAEGTLRNYDRYVRYVAACVSNQAISELSLFTLYNAIGEVRRENDYSLSTAGVIMSALRQIFIFAAEHGDAADITEYAWGGAGSLDVMALLGSGEPEDYIRQALRDERDKLANKTMSLTIWQIKRLMELLWERIELDGRYCLICLMLYAGVRPAEGRALRWKDVVPFIDHPERSLINVYRIRDAQGSLQDRAKTENAYRRIPVHVELAAYLLKRRSFVEAYAEGPIDDFPICCFENDFSRPCRDYEAAELAKRLLERVRLLKEDLYAYQIECLSEKYEAAIARLGEEQHLTLYVLRRNFWTYLQACTKLSDSEKRVLMGHELEEWQSRKEENDENALWVIMTKLDHMILSKELHLPSITVKSDAGKVLVNNQGVLYIQLTPEALVKGGKVRMVLTLEEAGDKVYLKVLSPVRGIGGIPVQAYVTGAPALPSNRGINLDFSMWRAHEKPKRPKKKKVDD